MNNLEKTKTTIYMDKSLLKQINICTENYSYKSRNEFLIKAIENQIASDMIENTSDIFSEKLSQAIEKHNNNLGKRVSKGLYRYAVELSMIMHMQAWQLGITDEQIDGIRKVAMADVKKLRGKIHLEEISNFQNDREKRYENERIDDEWDD